MSIGDVSRLARITPEAAADIRQRILATGFADRVPAPVEMASTLVPEELRRPLVVRALQREEGLAGLLTLLFLYTGAVERAPLRRGLGTAYDALVDAGILIEDGGEVRSAFRLQVAYGVFIWADEPTGGPEAVMAPGPSTVQLLDLLPSQLRNATLCDVGTGPGTLALLAAARGAARVVGTDISERAITLARVNAAFNGLGAEFHAGDLLAPVGGEGFDWVVAQPPYVTHPEDEPGVTYMHGGPKGDELAMRLLGEIPWHLRRHGVALVLFDSPVRQAPVQDRARQALADDEVDLAVFNEPGIPVDRQAFGYAAIADPAYGARYAETAVRYRDHLERQGITEVTHTLAVIRRSAERRAGWTMALPVPRFPSDWPDVRSYLAAVDLLVAGDGAIATSHVRPRSGARVVTTRDAGAPRARAARTIGTAELTMAADHDVSEAGALIYDLLAQDSSVAAAIDRFAAAMEQPRNAVAPLVVAFVRDCLVRALLVPA